MLQRFACPMKTNTLYAGDCLDRMGEWADACVDLIYLDPPFNSKANYNILFGKGKGKDKKDDLAQMTAFEDTWQWDVDAEERVNKISKAIDHPAHYAIKGFDTLFRNSGNGMLAYLSYMAERLAEMQRLLKPTGSIYLHCDPTASHYLKTVMDEIFGTKNFRNEIVWKKTNSPKAQSKVFGAQHDIVFLYSKTDDFCFRKITKEPDEDYLRSYRHSDDVGRYQTVALSNNTELGGFGKMKVWKWRGVSARWIYSKDNLEKWWSENRIVKTPSGYRKKVYLHEIGGPLVSDIWVDKEVAPIQAKERLGYPTQKPIALLERIISASSNEGDVVLDPFCGCGTTIHAALNLKRNWMGIDISYYAIEVIRRERLKDVKIELEGVPTNLEAAAYFSDKDPFEFEKWAVSRIHGFAPNTVQRGDGGIDGRALIWNAEREQDLCIAQVKRGKPSVDALGAFQGKIAAGEAAIGLFITLRKQKETPTMKKLIAKSGYIEVGGRKFHRLVMWSIEEFFHDSEPKIPHLAHPRTGEPLQEDVLDRQDKLLPE